MATVELHGLEPGEKATLHRRVSQPVVPESPGPELAKKQVRKNGSVIFDDVDPGPYVVRAGGLTLEVQAKDEPARPLRAAERGADVTVQGARTTATRRR